MIDIEKVADEANVIVNGYAFTLIEQQCRVINLNKLECATVLDKEGNIVETSMDDIELKIVQKYYAENKKYMEV